MNALELLKEDHQKVKKLFEETTKTSDRSRQKELFDKIDSELEIHHPYRRDRLLSDDRGTGGAKGYGCRSSRRAPAS